MDNILDFKVYRDTKKLEDYDTSDIVYLHKEGALYVISFVSLGFGETIVLEVERCREVALEKMRFYSKISYEYLRENVGLAGCGDSTPDWRELLGHLEAGTLDELPRWAQRMLIPGYPPLY